MGRSYSDQNAAGAVDSHLLMVLPASELLGIEGNPEVNALMLGDAWANVVCRLEKKKSTSKAKVLSC
jgi:hypothetical protein